MNIYIAWGVYWLLIPFEWIRSALTLRVTLFFGSCIHYKTVVVDIDIRSCINIENSLRITTTSNKILKPIIINIWAYLCISFHNLVIDSHKLFLLTYNQRLSIIWHILIDHHWWIPWLWITSKFYWSLSVLLNWNLTIEWIIMYISAIIRVMRRHSLGLWLIMLIWID